MPHSGGDVTFVGEAEVVNTCGKSRTFLCRNADGLQRKRLVRTTDQDVGIQTDPDSSMGTGTKTDRMAILIQAGTYSSNRPVRDK